jgi:endonuclease-8
VPEGDTIYRAARALHKALAGGVVVGFDTGLAKLARVNDDTPLRGRIVEKVESRGKWCLVYLSGDLILVTHMLMSGSWHLYRAGERWRMPRQAMRVMFRVAQHREPGGGDETANVAWEAVAFNVPIAEFHTARSLARSSQVPDLGPDLLAEDFTVDRGTARLEAYALAHPEAEIGVALLNQRVLAGLGNVYKSEVAFAAQVNPWRKMRTLTRAEMDRMVEFAQRYMQANVADGQGDGIVTYAGNRRTTHSMNREERVWAYGRQGMECRRCGAAIMMRKQGEQARSTYWCPECQPWIGEGLAPVGNVRVTKRIRQR